MREPNAILSGYGAPLDTLLPHLDTGVAFICLPSLGKQRPQCTSCVCHQRERYLLKPVVKLIMLHASQRSCPVVSMGCTGSLELDSHVLGGQPATQLKDFCLHPLTNLLVQQAFEPLRLKALQYQDNRPFISTDFWHVGPFISTDFWHVGQTP
jgi:hypothetical protein